MALTFLSSARARALRAAAAASPASVLAGRRAFTAQSGPGGLRLAVASASDAAAPAAPTSTITVAVKAGPRHETAPGAAHVLKNFAFKSTEGRSALRLVRETELYGGVLSASLTKEYLFLTAEFLQGDEAFFAEILGQQLTQAKFFPHEYKEVVVPQVQAEYEQAVHDASTLAFDSLTQTAYRGRGLGASLFASPSAPLTLDRVVSFANAAFAKSNVAILGSGMSGSDLSRLVEKHFAGLANTSSLTSGSTAYHGGDQRIPFSGPKDQYLLAFPGGPSSTNPEFAVLRAILGGEAAVKWSSGLSPLSKAAESVQGASAQAFNVSFSDAGLFGVRVEAPTSKVSDIVKAAIGALKDVAGGVKAEELQKAVAKAKFAAASALEGRTTSVELAAAQLLEKGEIATVESTFQALESVDAASVSKAADKVLKSSPTSVAVGNVYALPYVDELGL